MHVSKVPETLVALVPLAVKALAGAENHDVGLRLNTQEAIAADLYDLTGNPSNPLMPGKQAILDRCKQTLKDVRSEARAAIARGREYCRLGVALLKPVLGMTHNGDWNAAGFLNPSLAMPDNPVVMLIEFRHYFVANPAQENAQCGITAADAHDLMSAIQAAQLAVAAAETALLNAKKARDVAQRRLKKRISGLRAELVQLLSPEDGAWWEFGFRRPADGRAPAPVTELRVTEVESGIVLVEWAKAPRAVNYRVECQSSSETTSEIVASTQCVFTGISPGPVLINISARNATGESAAVSISIRLSVDETFNDPQTSVPAAISNGALT